MQHTLCPDCRSLGPTAIELVCHLPVKMTFAESDTLHVTTYVAGPGIETRLKLDRPLACLTARQLLKRHPRIGNLTNQLVRGMEVDESRGMIPIDAIGLASQVPALVLECKRRKKALALYSICADSTKKNVGIFP
jgi:hypothetical protein